MNYSLYSLFNEVSTGINYIYNQNLIYKHGMVGQSRIFATSTIFLMT